MLIRWGSWSQRAARVAPRANEVPPHRGSIVSHPRISNSSKSLQPQQPGDGNGDLPGRYRPARCGNSNPTGWLLIGWGSWSHRAARVALPAIVEVAPLTGRLRSHPRIRNPSMSLQFRQIWNRDGDPTVDTAQHSVESPPQGTPLLIGVREASGPHPMGVRSSASSLTVIKYCTATCC